ncbi:prepilin peptidase [Nevskia soli]|uniref:prepilin peptidase n=1 Tax=Nevskia soli TaxID=418856 RepID=UPI0004A6AB34|nr:A24 family peptidase [Nevskia soli]
MSLIEALRANFTLLVGLAGVLGLLVGSFLNVVALRLPRMMEAEWKREARLILELPEEDPPPLRITLSQPPSCCTSCGARIRPWHNLPLLGWLWLRGRCADCRAPISPQYPLVELASGVLSAACAWHFGWGPQLAAGLVLSWTLLVLTVIDFRDQLLPDAITLPLLWVGLCLACFGVFTTPPMAIAGAVFGYLSLWLIYHGYRLLTGKEGMGHGDFKLLAALGAWFGATSLPMIILLSSLVGSVIGISLILFRGRDRNIPISFGPYLAGAGWLTLIWGDALRGLSHP